jgi:hypothetical protein
VSLRNTNLQFYVARAAQARAEGEAATLAHVRERCRRSEAAWAELAERATRSEKLKAAEASRKADSPPQVRYENEVQDHGPSGPEDPQRRGQD